jgi:integrase
MNFVEPIRDRKKIAQIKNLLRGEERFRDLLLFTVGINTALRISDLLRLRVEHFIDAQKGLRRRFVIREEKRTLMLTQILLSTQTTLSSSILKPATILSLSSEGKPGSSSQPSANRWDYEATSAPIACARPGATTPG